MINQPSVSTFLRKTARHLRMKRNEDKEVQDFQGFPIGGSRRLPPLALVKWKNGHVFSRVAAGRSVSHLRNHFKNSRRLPTSVDEKTKNNSEKWFYLRFLPRTFICLTKRKWQFENFKICSGSTSGNRKVPPLALENWKKGHVFSRVSVCRSVSHLKIAY